MNILKNLEWGNCFSYGNKNSLKLNDSTLTQIIGLNGAGKSSIPLIIEEVLFNKNSKGVKKTDIPNRFLGGSYWIKLELDRDGSTYLIDLERSKTTKLKLIKDGVDISSHTATDTFKTIESILGYPFKTFSQIAYQNVKNSLAFLTATDTERKKFLIELLNLSRYVEIHEVFKEASKKYSNKKIELDTRINTLSKWISENNLKGMKVLPELKMDILLEENENDWARLTAEIKNILEKNKTIEKNNFYRKQLDDLEIDKYQDYPIDSKEFEDESAELGNLKGQNTAAKATLTKIAGLSDQCPTCLQAIDSDFKDSLIAENDDVVDSTKTKASAIQVSISKKKAHNVLVGERMHAEQQFESVFRSIDEDLQTEIVDKVSLELELTSIKAIIAEKKLEVDKILKENVLRDRNNTKISLIEEQSEKIQSELDTISVEYDSLMKTVSKMEVLKKAFSPNGLIAYKIENKVKELEDLVNEYLIELSDGRFSLLFAVEKDKLNVHIIDNGSTIDISSLSSGELARVNTATLLAIRKLMNSLSKSQLNILFLDEVINVLDENGREKLVEILLNEKDLNIFLVSHGWTHPLISKVHVVKDNEISRVENG